VGAVGVVLATQTLAVRAVESSSNPLPPLPTAKSRVSPAATPTLTANENVGSEAYGVCRLSSGSELHASRPS